MGKASGVFALIGALAAVIGVFSGWIGDFELTGWDLYKFTEGMLEYYFAPLAIVILGAVTVLVAGIAIGGKGGAGSRILFSLTGVGMIVLIVMFFNELIVTITFGEANFIDLITKHREGFGIGFWMVLGGGIMTAIAAAVPGK